MSRSPTIAVLAGEPSGDRIGASLVAALRDGAAPGAAISGVGGAAMAAQGIRSPVPITDLSVMGLVEVLPNLPRILRRLRQIVDWLEAMQPDVVVTIDSPDFMHRVVIRARPRCPRTQFVNYVAPTVWAWRAGRAKKLARLYDLQLALLPFEPPYFEAVGLPADSSDIRWWRGRNRR